LFGVGYDPADAWSLLREAAAILLVGGAIKLMDDFLDLRYDVFEGEPSLAVRLGEGTLAYALLLFALAALADARASCALFLGAYAAGMAGDFDRQLPSGLYGYQEAAAALVAGLLFLPWPWALWGLSVMVAVQAVDDLEDLAPDHASGNPNLARRLGVVETQLLGVLTLFLAALLRPVSTAVVFVAVPLLLWAARALVWPARRAGRWER